MIFRASPREPRPAGVILQIGAGHFYYDAEYKLSVEEAQELVAQLKKSIARARAQQRQSCKEGAK